jgi:hypothetical protein
MGHKLLGFDAYNFNFVALMVLTAIEVFAVGIDLTLAWTAFILISIGIVKGLGIAAIFMHLWGDGDSSVLTMTALFPVFFIGCMFLFVALTSPGGTDTLPGWCRPGFYGL